MKFKMNNWKKKRKNLNPGTIAVDLNLYRV